MKILWLNNFRYGNQSIVYIKVYDGIISRGFN